MIFDFPTILVLVTIFTGVVSLVDVIYCHYMKKKGRAAECEHKPVIIDYSRSFFPVLLLVLVIRSFIAQPYRVPTGSLEPTVMPGDFILVTQYDYGLRLPAWSKKIINIGEPKNGHIALFFWPVNHAVTFVKRVIGLPGDHISYINKVLYLNGKKAEQTFVGYATDQNSADGPVWRDKVYEENLNGVKHKIYVCAENEPNCPNPMDTNFYNLVVPPGHYFMMGDNRDDSDDSRAWGFVSEKELIGRARYVWMNWDPFATSWAKKIQWNRFGIKL